jgi:DNA-binding XRE family transcriptional regulator
MKVNRLLGLRERGMSSVLNEVHGFDLSDRKHTMGAWLKQLREQAGLTQRDMAAALGLEYYTFISQLENGRGKIPSQRYSDWARVLKIDQRQFVKGLLMYTEPSTYSILFGE